VHGSGYANRYGRRKMHPCGYFETVIRDINPVPFGDNPAPDRWNLMCMRYMRIRFSIRTERLMEITLVRTIFNQSKSCFNRKENALCAILIPKIVVATSFMDMAFGMVSLL
ncbi:MAG: hypothetical protein K2K70_09115, partial [Lachnospiraceae bacterium]|nr:hypothetical protein [Lachnospiraceae bacterium]